MNALDILRSASGALRGNRKRTGLSLLGVSIGVAAVLVLSGLGEGARSYLRGQFEFMGTDVVAILPGKVETSGGIPGIGAVPNDLTIADAVAVRRGGSRAKLVAPIAIGNDTVSAGERSRQVVIFGTTAEHADIRSLVLHSGRFLPEEPWERGSRVAVLGRQVATELFPGTNPIGGVVRIGGWRMRVIGVLGSQGVRFGMNMDEVVFVPVATGLAMFDKSSLFRIVAQVRPGASIDALQASCASILYERHREEDFTITTPDAILDSLESILTMLTFGLAGIASISLAVAGIGIMNVMLVCVSERTEEIGLSKALGAEPSQILVLFLAEAAMISALGAALGLALGYGLLRGAAWALPAFPFQAPLWAAAAAATLAIAVGVTFGLWPAARAVRLDPVMALTGRAR